MHKYASEILEFWFKKSKPIQWFDKNIKYDNLIKKNFLKQHKMAINGDFENWKNYAEESLALIILIDQFSRNIFRGNSKSFEFDYISLDFCKVGLEKSYHKELANNDQKLFFILPLIHSENVNDQKLAIELLNTNFINDSKFSDIKFFFQRHYEIIEKFGRFPHRNQILNRVSSQEEIDFLKTPYSSF